MNSMRKIYCIAMLCAVAVSAMAVPARPGWQTRTQADGTTIEVQLVGDEFYHYTMNRDGKIVQLNENGMYEVVGDVPTEEVVLARRAKAKALHQTAETGVTPNLAPKGVVILVNFSDKTFDDSHTQAMFDDMFNSANCTTNTYSGIHYPSAAEYFSSQSNGAYRPQFDVFGPVTLSGGYASYGKDYNGEGNDKNAAGAVVEGCLLADKKYTINWADYDSNNDGYVDFVYMIYAGRGQADGAESSTIWPHNWNIEEAISYGYCTYNRSQCVVGGKHLNSYACSSELDGSSLCGIGTLCHEFGHVMGLPDFYDTNYGTNYKNELTPGEWDIMDGGAYNGGGHCPPNYSPWEKYFFGWQTPVNLGNNGQTLNLIANGVEGYQSYQVNESGEQQGATTSGQCYYFENRQKKGWDKYVPAAGMVIWKVNYNATKWAENTPNNTARKPLYTIVCSNGTKVGSSNGKGNVFPYSNKTITVDSWEDVVGKPLNNIAQSGGIVTLNYIHEGQGLEDVEDGKQAQKILRDGHLVIIRDGKEYDATGRRL